MFREAYAMLGVFKFLLVVLVFGGLLLLLLKWIERRILARTQSERPFEPFSLEASPRSSGEGAGAVDPADPVRQAAARSAQTEEAERSAVDGNEAICPCCGQPVKSGPGQG